MAYFHCLIGGGSSGGGYELTVTCDADFAGTTITCTDGVTTLTQTCPSASPYEVVFEIPNGGDWTISGVVGGHTVSTGVNIPTSAELIAIVQQTVTIYSAKEDTISYTDIDGATQTITFASGETSKQVQITIEPNGSSITFTSSVAKNPDNLSQDYSKTFTITTSTTDIYLMPDAVKTLYWWGYESNDLEDATNANGWSGSQSATYVAPTHNTNDIYCNSSGNYNFQGITTKQPIASANKICSVMLPTVGAPADPTQKGYLRNVSSKSYDNTLHYYNFSTTSLEKGEVDVSNDSNFYIFNGEAWGAKGYIYALWYE